MKDVRRDVISFAWRTSAVRLDHFPAFKICCVLFTVHVICAGLKMCHTEVPNVKVNPFL